MVQSDAQRVSAMRVHVDADVCEGHALCVMSAKTVFELNDDERAVVMDVELTDDVLAQVRTAIVRCPVQAISLQTNGRKVS